MVTYVALEVLVTPILLYIPALALPDRDCAVHVEAWKCGAVHVEVWKRGGCIRRLSGCGADLIDVLVGVPLRVDGPGEVVGHALEMLWGKYARGN